MVGNMNPHSYDKSHQTSERQKRFFLDFEDAAFQRDITAGANDLQIVNPHNECSDLVEAGSSENNNPPCASSENGQEKDCPVEEYINRFEVGRTLLAPGTLIGVGRLQRPGALCIDRQGNIIVGDCRSGEVIFFPRNGACARTLVSGARGLTGVTVDKQGRLLIVEKLEHRVVVYSPPQRTAAGDDFPSAWTIHSIIGREGSGPGELQEPRGLAVSPCDGRIYVADFGNNRIQAFWPDGSPAGSLGHEGSEPGQLRGPKYVCVDVGGSVAVTDNHNHRVQVFGADGGLQRCFGGYGAGEGLFKHPNAVACGPGGRLVVTDQNNHRVQVAACVAAAQLNCKLNCSDAIDPRRDSDRNLLEY